MERGVVEGRRLVLGLALALGLLGGCVALAAWQAALEPTATPDTQEIIIAVAGAEECAPTPTATPAPEPTPDISAWRNARSRPAKYLEDPLPKVLPRQQPVAEGSLPVLMYHYVRVNPDPADKVGAGLSVSPRDFEAQMAFLAQRGYRSVLLRDLDNPSALKGRVVAITFDDGYADAYDAAYPILRKYGFKATFYIITGLVGRPRYMSWEQIAALAADGNAIGSHTITHPDLRTLNAQELRRQLVESKAEIEKRLGQPVRDFCYPAGFYNATVSATTRDAGYLTAVTTRNGWHPAAEGRFELSRVRISGQMTLADYAVALRE